MSEKILIVSANYYKNISNNLEKKAESLLKNSAHIKYKVTRVPGVFELPVIISKNINKYDGFIALGCVIKGKTPHFKFISTSTINAIMHLSIAYKKPIGNGIITCLSKRQAFDRSRKGNNKGEESARVILSLLKI